MSSCGPHGPKAGANEITMDAFPGGSRGKEQSTGSVTYAPSSLSHTLCLVLIHVLK